jgi:tripartite-type tricarboxylate transporter receptor subunit TctC
MKSNALLRGGACLYAALALTVGSAAFAQKVDFSGKRVEMLVPFTPGGGSDVYARALAPFFEKYSRSICRATRPSSCATCPGAARFRARTSSTVAPNPTDCTC